MTEEEFWKLIAASRESSTDCESQCVELQRVLSELPVQKIVDFARLFSQKVVDTCRWDLWGVAYLIHRGCLDGGFENFRYWLIGQGREVYQQVLADPQSILNYLKAGVEEAECEGLLYAIGYALHSTGYADEYAAGAEMPFVEMEYPLELIGEPWEKEDLKMRFPKVAARYL